MSIQRWKDLAKEETEVEAQNAKILRAMRMHKVEKEFGQLTDKRKALPGRLRRKRASFSGLNGATPPAAATRYT